MFQITNLEGRPAGRTSGTLRPEFIVCARTRKSVALDFAQPINSGVQFWLTSALFRATLVYAYTNTSQLAGCEAVTVREADTPCIVLDSRSRYRSMAHFFGLQTNTQ